MICAFLQLEKAKGQEVTGRGEKACVSCDRGLHEGLLLVAPLSLLSPLKLEQ